MPDITLEHANQLVARGLAAAEKAGMKAVFAILDSGANLVAFARMDGAWLASNELAIAKARTSVMFQAPTEGLAAPLQLGQPALHFDHIHAGGLLLVGGGVPLFDQAGALIGGLRASGGSPEQDAELARLASA
ncbi:GlcG/HbpS family heme-binding protein [Mycobacteroides abscessus]|uniref:GlcG/HbpS family heme-binding protein n=1 Tax=Mycobacteroides abscessus TaxID=36809 RepID=UPI0019D20510|nr:heme-binding protein [Mycobacteroides abscessus]MBN7474676.1 heme-binding protein [Mycobacteroides abscessus subsp. abscessus]